MILKIYHPDPAAFEKSKIQDWLSKAITYTTDLSFNEKKPFVFETITG